MRPAREAPIHEGRGRFTFLPALHAAVELGTVYNRMTADTISDIKTKTPQYSFKPNWAGIDGPGERSKTAWHTIFTS